MSDYYILPQQALQTNTDQLGGKAQQLAWLQQHKFNVPAWFVLTTSAFSELLQQANLQPLLRSLTQDNVSEVAQQIHTVCQTLTLPNSILSALNEGLTTQKINEHDYVAVRSSIVGEDSATASFAGQMDSFLFQQGQQAITESILKVFASAFSERALAYRQQHGFSVDDIQVAVIIQRMIEGDVSGVMFTANPTTGNRKEVVISACYGSGEGVVSGICDSDEYCVDITHAEITKQHIVKKDQQIIFDRITQQGTITTEVSVDKQQQPCLSKQHIQQLMQQGVDIAIAAKMPQDIEWTYVDNQFYILQTRPITALPPAQSKHNMLVWDNSNIQESYFGVTTPLTFSFASRAYARAYEQTMILGGVSSKIIEANRTTLNNFLSIMYGRIYYNINNWYWGLGLLPSFKTNKSDMERMMGLQDPVDFIEDKNLSAIQKLKKLPMMIGLLTRLLLKFRKIDQLVHDFQQMFETEYKKISRKTLHQLEISELMALLRQIDQRLLLRWTTPIINDFYVMMMNGKVNRYLEKAGLGKHSPLLNQLLAGEEGIESTEPTKMLLRLCVDIRNDQALKSLFETVPDHQLLAAIQITNSSFYQKCLDYIERYGDRVMGELKLETISLHEDTSFMFTCLKNYLPNTKLTIETLQNNERRMRQEAEEKVISALKLDRHPYQRKRFFNALNKLRQAIKHRENMRLARTRKFGLYRSIYREIGQQLTLYGSLAQVDDIFYLTVQELEAYEEGRSVFNDWAALVAIRRKEYQNYQQQTLPHHFITHGIPYLQSRYDYPYADPNEDESSSQLQGIGCYPGVVEKTIRLIFQPQDAQSLDGQILCTERTDPGWAPLFPSAGGILVERGSTLSHSAVVARELGIPAIVGIPNLTKLLTDKELVRMNGETGILERLES